MSAIADQRPDVIKRITSVPSNVPQDMIRYYVYWKIFYVAAGLAHFLSIFLFAYNGVTFMAIFNIGSVAIFVTAFVLLKTGHYRIAYWGAVGEVTLHGIAAMICVGPSFGFQNYAFLVPVLLFIQPFYGMRFSIAMTAATLASAGIVTWYALNNPPIYTVPQSEEHGLIISSSVSWPIFILIMVLPFIRASARAEKALAEAYDESERLLLNILPEPIADRLKETEGMIADDHDRVAILFADIVGFTQMSGRLRPAQVVAMLNEVFNAIDALVARHGVEKIKTIGDAYMAVAGVPAPLADPDGTIADLALEIQDAVSHIREPGTGNPVQVRIGINSGSIVAGVIGNRKFAYDLWGDAVNLAARMESTGEPGRIQVPGDLADRLADRFVIEPRGEVDVKGKGRIATAYLVGRKGG